MSPLRCPYVGLQHFTERDSDLYFGREGQSDELLRKLANERFLAVVGTSASGKSSLLRAGLFPSLLGGYLGEAGAHWRFAEMSPGRGPLGRLSKGLSEAGFGEAPSAEQLRCDGGAIAKWFAHARSQATRRFAEASVVGDPLSSDAERRSLGAVGDRPSTDAKPRSLGAAAANSEGCEPDGPVVNLLILADQFEELFRYPVDNSTPSEDRKEKSIFVRHLLAAFRQREVPIYVVLAMRSEFLGDCARYRDLAEEMNESQYLIPRLSREQRRRAIEGPLITLGSCITPKATQRVLNDCGDDPDQLPLMQHALMRMWDTAIADAGAAAEERAARGFDVDDYANERVGGIAKGLSNHANEIFERVSKDLGPRGKEIVKRIFLLLYDRQSF